MSRTMHQQDRVGGDDDGALRRLIDYAATEATEQGRPMTARLLGIARQSLDGAGAQADVLAEGLGALAKLRARELQ